MSIVETMVVIVIVAILLAIGVPGMQSWLAEQRVAAKAQSILGGLQLARLEAIKRNTRVFFTISNDSSWSIGCVTPADGNGDGDTLDIEDCPATIQSQPAAEGGEINALTLLLTDNSPTASATATFNGTGMVNATNGDGTQPLARIDVSASAGGADSTLRVLLTLGGQSRICDPEIETTGDPNKCPN